MPRATVPHNPPIPAATDFTALGCTSSATPPQLHTLPIETTRDQFTHFEADGALLPAGPATIKLVDSTVGTVEVNNEGTFDETGFKVPAHAAHCGQATVAVAHGGPTLATSTIAVYCPAITAAPNPVDSGGRAANLTVIGTGFPANRPIDLGIDGRIRTTATSDATGAVHGTIRGVAPSCGAHQVTATAQHPTRALNPAPTATLTPPTSAYLPVSAATNVIVVGCAKITADPRVLQQGMLTHVTGTGFLPRTPLAITWQNTDGTTQGDCAPDAISAPHLVTDAAGSIDAYCLAFRNELSGALTIAAVQPPERETAPVVVEAGPMQPSSGGSFVFRR